MEKVTVKTMAAHFGVSIASISKALNGLPGVSEQLRKQIVEYAQEHQYIPDMFGQGLKGVKCGTIGVIMPDNTNPVYSVQLKGIESEARKHAYSVILCNSGDNWLTEKRHIQMLMQKKVDGIMMIPAAEKKYSKGNRYAEFEKARIPFLMMNRVIDGCTFDVVKPDNAHAARIATEYLFQKGHRRVIHITSEKNYSSSRERLEGFKAAHREAGIAYRKTSVYYCDISSIESCYNAASRILEQGGSFTAIFAFNDFAAFGIMKAILDRGLRIPEDVALMGYDNIDFADICAVPLTTVKQESYHIGSMSFRYLLERINGSSEGRVCHIITPTEIIERETV